ncbi:MAG TPA: hypothetical protein GXZ47_05075 [Treponema sp.]|nr:hypothetical protein [Treponema sp.]
MIFLAALLKANMPLQAKPVFPLPAVVSFTQKIEHPTQNTDIKFRLDSKALYSTVQFENKTGFSNFSPELYTWNLAFKPGYGIQVLGGSIATSGLPSRVKNLIPPLVTPVFRPVIPGKNWVLSPGTTRSKESCAIEINQDQWGLVFFSNPASFPEENTWIYSEFSAPSVLPFETSIHLSVFSGFRQFSEKTESSWFIPSQQRPHAITLFPAAELIVGNRNLTASATALGNIPQLEQNSGAIRSDAAINLGWLTLAAGFFQSAIGFTEFDGSVPVIRERRLLAPSLTIPISYVRRTVLRMHFLYAQDITSPQKLEDVFEAKQWYGSRISIESSKLFLQGTGIYKNEQYSCSGQASVFRFLVPWFRITFKGKASLPDNNISRRAWVNQEYRIQLNANGTNKNKKGTVSCSGSMAQKDQFSPIHYSIRSIISGTVITKHIKQILTTECTFSTQKPAFSAKFYFSTFLR